MATVSAAKGTVIAAGVIELMTKHGIITPDHTEFDLTRTADEWALLAKEVIDLLEKEGVEVPEKVKQVADGLAFYIPLIKGIVLR